MLNQNPQFLESAYFNLADAKNHSKAILLNRFKNFVSASWSLITYCLVTGFISCFSIICISSSESTNPLKTVSDVISNLPLTIMLTVAFGLLNFAFLQMINLGEPIKNNKPVTSAQITKSLKLAVSDLQQIEQIDYRLYPSFIEQINKAANKIKAPPTDPNYFSIESSKLAILDFTENSSRLLEENKVD
jgi:hypothetical protein